ncbi:MAG: hypothetical protein WBF17_03670 [Phycisphaerae bacterium]
MSSEARPTPLQKLRSYVAHLEQENRRLRGQAVPSEAAVVLQRENDHLRREIAAGMPRASSPAGRDRLTLPEVAQMLNLSTYEVLRNLRDSLPMGVDDRGNTVVAREDVDAYLLARSQGRSTQRFL